MEVESPPPAVVARWRSILDVEEQARADRFLRPIDAVTYTAAHALVRSLLAHAGRVAAPAWRFVTGPHGKPSVDPALGSALTFSLAHAPGLVVAAVRDGGSIGVDAEPVGRAVAALAIAERHFAPAEVSLLRGLGEECRKEAFCRLWTLKEAFLKATGAGLAGLETVSFSLDPETLALRGVKFGPDVGQAPDEWRFYQYRLGKGHVMALVTARDRSDVAPIVARVAAAEELSA